MFNVKWGNDLATLADALFSSMAAQAKADTPAMALSHRDCIVVPNQLTASWLQHQYLYQQSQLPLPRVLANYDFPLLHVFVNDWLYQMNHPVAPRDAMAHPFSIDAMCWRIYRILNKHPDLLQNAMPLKNDASSTTKNSDELSRFRFSKRLAKMFDEYAVYRSEMLIAWEQKKHGNIPANLVWQPELWLHLTRGANTHATYHDSFKRMASESGINLLKNSGITRQYKHIRVFGVSMMPRPYLWFFRQLGRFLNVDLFLFNPCCDAWFDAPIPRQVADNFALEASEDTDDSIPDKPSCLLSLLGKGCREFLAETLDATDGQAEADSTFTEPDQTTILGALQSEILHNQDLSSASTTFSSNTDTSLQFHICHNKLRELEILRDHILAWFNTIPDLQPRDIQVQISDMAEYAPLIDAVFSSQARLADQTIPYVIADRVAMAENPAAKAFLGMLALAENRFTAANVLELLHFECIAETFGFQPGDVDKAAEWSEAAGIRWGYDAKHRHDATGLMFADYTTWRRGLDRLLLGYAHGTAENVHNLPGDPIPMPCDQTEDDDAIMLGHLVDFVEHLRPILDWNNRLFTPNEWAEKLHGLLDVFFTTTNDTYQDVYALRNAIIAFEKTAYAADFNEPLSLPILREFLTSRLQNIIGGGNTSANAVLFNALRPGSSTPRRMLCLLGMGDNLFPCPDNRASYDLLGIQRKIGDRSMRIEGRMAWLEAIMSARDKLYISYVGFDQNDLTRIPPSVLVCELLEQAKLLSHDVLNLEINHKLRAFDPVYFTGDQYLFSFSKSNFAAAKTMLACAAKDRLSQSAPPSTALLQSENQAAITENSSADTQKKTDIELDDLIKFFQHPARWHYLNILGVNLNLKHQTILEETEAFYPEKLDAFQVNQIIIDAMIDARAKIETAGVLSATKRRLLEQGLIPLEQWGEKWFLSKWHTLQDFIETDMGELGKLGNALYKQRSAALKHLAVTLVLKRATISISGAITVIPGANNQPDTAIDFRYTSKKPAAILGCWIKHVFACAAGINEMRHFIAVKNLNTGKGKTVDSFNVLERNNAKELLAELAEAYYNGHKAIPPFTPAAAAAFVEHYRATDLTEEALRKARATWKAKNEKFDIKDEQDPYYSNAFGANGPFQNKDLFMQYAAMLFNPLLENSTTLKI